MKTEDISCCTRALRERRPRARTGMVASHLTGCHLGRPKGSTIILTHADHHGHLAARTGKRAPSGCSGRTQLRVSQTSAQSTHTRGTHFWTSGPQTCCRPNCVPPCVHSCRSTSGSTRQCSPTGHAKGGPEQRWVTDTGICLLGLPLVVTIRWVMVAMAVTLDTALAYEYWPG